MSGPLTSSPFPLAGPAPAPSAAGIGPFVAAPQPRLTPNPYGQPDAVVVDRAGHDHAPTDGLRDLWNVVAGDDWSAATDPQRSWQARTGHAILLAANLAGPEELGLKLAGKVAVEGVTHFVYEAAARGGAKAVTGGKLVVAEGLRLEPQEAKLAADLVRRGDVVEVMPRSNVGRSADFRINGVLTELKSVSNVRSTSSSARITKIAMDATKQAKSVIIDARGQAGFIRQDATRSIENALNELPRSRVEQIRILGRDALGEFDVIRRKA